MASEFPRIPIQSSIHGTRRHTSVSCDFQKCFGPTFEPPLGFYRFYGKSLQSWALFFFLPPRLIYTAHCVQRANLCDHLPGGGAVLAGLDAEVPPPLQDVDDGLGGDVEAGGPADLQLTRGEFFEAQLLPRLQRSAWRPHHEIHMHQK